MATDYDAPRSTGSDASADSHEELPAGRAESRAAIDDVEEADTAESFELPGADLSGEELTARIVSQKSDEFTCTRCFLVHHRNRLADAVEFICRDCAD